jgi:PAS domain S-box-containing protein
LEQALENVGVPSYVLDTNGGVRWINAAAERLIGDVRGRHFSSVVAPEDTRRARELFARKVLRTVASTDASGVLVSSAGARVAVEISAVPLTNGERVAGVFGLFEERPHDRMTVSHPHPTPPPGGGASSVGAGALDEADRRRAAPERRNGQKPYSPAISGTRRQLATRSCRRRPRHQKLTQLGPVGALNPVDAFCDARA